MNLITRRAAFISAAIAGLFTLTTRNANASTITDQYNPSDITALGIGATTDGYIERTGPTYDDAIATYNLQAGEQRAAITAADQRDNLAQLRAIIAPPTSSLRILCAGDSLTIGTGSYEGTGYRPWLVDHLARQRIEAKLTTVAEGGQTLSTMTPKILAALPTAKPDVVLIHLGTNDAAQPDLINWQTRYGQLIDQILASSPTVKVVCARINISRPAWIVPLEQQVNSYVDAAVAARRGTGRVKAADMTTIDQRHTADGYHPLDPAYNLMAKRWTSAIMEPWTTG